MKYIVIWVLLLIRIDLIMAQVTFFKDIEPIILENCTPCHSPKGSAPFSLIEFKDVAKRSAFIKHVTETGYMPPWKANPSYRKFANEKILTKNEIELIKTWVSSGSIKGKKKDRKIKGGYEESVQLKSPKADLILKMKEPFQIPGNNEQTYICYKIPYDLPRDTFVSGINFIPGNRRLVHHASYQVLNVSQAIDRYSEPHFFIYSDSDFVNNLNDYGRLGLIDSLGNFPDESFHGGWLPGSGKQTYPEGTGFFLPKKGVFLIRNLHYAPSAIAETDQSEIALYFSPEKVDRKVLFRGFAPINPNPDSAWTIPADSVKTFEIKVKIGSDISLLSINPHMHLLGKYFKAYAITPIGDSIPLIEINDWDFNWQEFYHFKYPLKIPKGSFLKAVATYDNTSSNNQNPNDPPREVFFERGMDDKDEMMRLVFLYLPYKKGDENLNWRQ